MTKQVQVFFLPNGTRLYFELKDIIEGGTCEVQLDPFSLMISEKATSKILAAEAKRLSSVINSKIQITKLSSDYASFYMNLDLEKQNDDSLSNDLNLLAAQTIEEIKDHSNGCHFNFGLSSLPQGKKKDLILASICTSAVEGGGGGICLSPESKGFTRDTRAVFIDRIESRNAHDSYGKPILKLTNESLSLGTHRFQITGMGFNQSEMSMLMRIFPLSLLFLGFEKGYEFDNIKIVYPVRVIRICANDILNQQDFSVFVNGKLKNMTSLDLRYLFFRNIQKFIKAKPECIPAWVKEHKVMRTWKYILDTLRAGKIERLGDMLDWAIKYKYYSLFIKSRDVSWDNIENDILHQLIMMDISYQSVTEDSLFEAWGKMGLLPRARILDKNSISEAINNPPKSALPRAKLRAREISNPSYAYQYADWDHLKFEKGQMSVDLRNPFCGKDKLLINDVKINTREEEFRPYQYFHRSFG